MINQYSYSQVANYRDCPRKWYFSSVLRCETTQSPSAVRGSAVHAELETWLTDATPPTDPVALAMSEVWSEHTITSTVQVEFEARASVSETAEMRGYIDAYHPSARLITDWKTAGSTQYVPDPIDLANNVQLLTYAYMLGLAEKGAIGRHITGFTRGSPRAMIIGPVDLTPLAIRQTWTATCDSIAEMEIERSKPVSEVAMMLDACARYGGCPHRVNCDRVNDGLVVLGPYRPEKEDK
jgi:PD-(D/E)XK nuclease superfamily